jgi:hypothetical protein
MQRGCLEAIKDVQLSGSFHPPTLILVVFTLVLTNIVTNDISNHIEVIIVVELFSQSK